MSCESNQSPSWSPDNFFQQLLWFSFSFPSYLLGNQARRRRCCRMSLVCRMWGFNLHNISRDPGRTEAQSSFISWLVIVLFMFSNCVRSYHELDIFLQMSGRDREGPQTQGGILQTHDVLSLHSVLGSNQEEIKYSDARQSPVWLLSIWRLGCNYILFVESLTAYTSSQPTHSLVFLTPRYSNYLLEEYYLYGLVWRGCWLALSTYSM